jgi:hypothetical protein
MGMDPFSGITGQIFTGDREIINARSSLKVSVESYNYALEQFQGLKLLEDLEGKYLQIGFNCKHDNKLPPKHDVVGPFEQDPNFTKHRAQRQTPEAVEIHEKMLQLQKQIPGEDHPNTIMSMNNLAEIY